MRSPARKVVTIALATILALPAFTAEAAETTPVAQDTESYTPADLDATLAALKAVIIDGARRGENIAVWADFLGTKQKTRLAGADERSLSLRLADGKNVFSQSWDRFGPDDVANAARACALKCNDGRGLLAVADYHLSQQQWNIADTVLISVAEADPSLARDITKRMTFMREHSVPKATELLAFTPASSGKTASSSHGESAGNPRGVPPSVDPSWGPLVYTQANVRECEVSFDIGFTSFRDMYDSDEEKVRADMESLIKWINSNWVPEVMIHWTLKKIVIRKTAKEDPSHGQKSTSHAYKELPQIDPKRESDMLVKITLDVGGWSLGGWYSTGLRRAVVAHKYLRQHFDHEAAHGFNQWHGYGKPYERGSMNGSNEGPYAFIPRHHVFNFKEAPGIIASAAKLGRLEETGPYPHPVPPYAQMDFVRRDKGDSSTEAIPVDVLANDHTANNGRLWIKTFDSPTRNKGVVERSIGAGPAGRDVLLYRRPTGATPPDFDFFTYTLINEHGLERKGNVLVLFEEK